MPFTVVEPVVAADVFEEETDVFDDEADDEADAFEDEADDVFADDAAEEADVFEDAAADEAADEADADEAAALLVDDCDTGSEALDVLEPDFPAQPVRATVNTAAAHSTEAKNLFDLLINHPF